MELDLLQTSTKSCTSPGSGPRLMTIYKPGHCQRSPSQLMCVHNAHLRVLVRPETQADHTCDKTAGERQQSDEGSQTSGYASVGTNPTPIHRFSTSGYAIWNSRLATTSGTEATNSQGTPVRPKSVSILHHWRIQASSRGSDGPRNRHHPPRPIRTPTRDLLPPPPAAPGTINSDIANHINKKPLV